MYNHSHFLHIIHKKKWNLWHGFIYYLVTTLSTILRYRAPAELKVQPVKEEMTAQTLHVFKSHFNSEIFWLSWISVVYKLLLNTIIENFSICALFANCSLQIITIHHVCELTWPGWFFSVLFGCLSYIHRKIMSSTFSGTICLTFTNIFQSGKQFSNSQVCRIWRVGPVE